MADNKSRVVVVKQNVGGNVNLTNYSKGEGVSEVYAGENTIHGDLNIENNVSPQKETKSEDERENKDKTSKIEEKVVKFASDIVKGVMIGQLTK